MSETPKQPQGEQGAGRSAVDPSAAMTPPRPPSGGGGPAYAYPPPAPPKSGGPVKKFLLGVFLSIFLFALLANVYQAQIIAMLTGGPFESTYETGDSEDRIAIIPLEGLIHEGSYDFVRTAFRVIEKDPENLPKAIVLRIESGGGAVGASDRILHEIKAFRKRRPEIPIVASFGTLAASGGYYVAVESDHIVAEPTCITGSIGVMAQGFTINELLEKIGVTPEVHAADSSPKKLVGNDISRKWNEADHAALKDILNRMHDQFLQVVHTGRADKLGDESFTMEHTREVGDGRTFGTAEAIELKLVDSEGYLSDAIDEATKLAKMSEKPRVTIIRQPRGFSLLNLLGKSDAPAIDVSPREARNFVDEMTELRFEYRWQPGG